MEAAQAAQPGVAQQSGSDAENADPKGSLRKLWRAGAAIETKRCGPVQLWACRGRDAESPVHRGGAAP